MNSISKLLLLSGLALTANVAIAQGTMKPADPMSKPGMAAPMSSMSMQDCKDHMAKAKTESMTKADGTMKMDKACADMMKKDAGATKGAGSLKPGAPNQAGTPQETAPK